MKNIKINNLFIFLVGALSLVNIQILGLVSVSELIMTITFPILLISNANIYKVFSKNERQTVFMILIWAVGVIISDLINQTSMNLFFKGIGHPVMILFSFIFFSRILQFSSSFFKYFISGLGVASIFAYFTNQLAQNNFRFGIFLIIIAFSFIIIHYFWEKQNFKICFAILVILIILGFIGGGRSIGLILFMTVILLISSYILYKKKRKIEYKSINQILVAIIFVVVAAQELYITAVKNKLFVQEYQIKFEEQLNTGLPIIFSGRTEIYSSIEAIKDSPWIGHGSWSKNLKYTNIFFQKQNQDVTMMDDPSRKYGFEKIPSHSFIFGAWVEHGVIGLFFFLFFGKRLINVLLFFLNSFTLGPTPYVLFLCSSYLWHLFFSPLGSDKRIYVALILALNSYYINSTMVKEKRKKVFQEFVIKSS